MIFTHPLLALAKLAGLDLPFCTGMPLAFD